MRKVVNVNGKKIYVYRKGHEMKHLGRTFVRLWKEGEHSNYIFVGDMSQIMI